MGVGGYVGMGLLSIGIVMIARFGSYRHFALHVLGGAIAFVGSLILTFALGAWAILFVLGTGVFLGLALSQRVLARKMQNARQSLPPREPRPARIVDPLAPSPPPFCPEFVEMNDLLTAARREAGITPHGPSATLATPTPVLFLWVFAESPNMELINEIRRRFGPVEMLHGGGQLVADFFAIPSVLFGRADRHIEETEPEVLARIARFTRRRVRLPIPGLGDPRLAWWSYNSMLCTDGVWQFALDRLIERNEVFVMDLTDFSAEHDGCEYEIGVLLDRVPVRRCLFIIGPATDVGCVTDELRRAWVTMSDTSPNRDAASGPLRVVRSVHLRDKRRKGERLPDIDVEQELILNLLRDARDTQLPSPPDPRPRFAAWLRRPPLHDRPRATTRSTPGR